MTRFFPDDLIALRDDPKILALVDSVWTDIDPLDTAPDDWVTHADVPRAVIDHCIEEGKPPDDHLIVQFLKPFSGTAVVHKHAVVLVDRNLSIGCIVKRSPADAQSGTVTKTYVKCKLQPIYTDLPYDGTESWSHSPEANELWVQGEEVHYGDFRPQDYVTFKGWIGQIADVREEVTVRLQDGSIVRVKDPEDLTCPFWQGDYRKVNRRWLEGNGLIKNLRSVQEMLARTTDLDAMIPPPFFHPGQRVKTKKSNLRLGQWLVGRYNPSTSPSCIVVETRIIEIDVDWITTNMFDPEAARQVPPDPVITTDDLDQVKVCSSELRDSRFGTRTMYREMTSRDVCRFRDEAGAAVKYSTSSGSDYFRRIPRTKTQGFNMNALFVRETFTEADVQWQDGTQSKHAAVNLAPYVNTDEHDLWPGDVVSIKDQEVAKDGLVHAKKLGIVQTVDSSDRVANIRWYSNPDIACFADDPLTMVPGGTCGDLSNETSTMSLYEIAAFPAMTKNRGDIVLLSPELTSAISGLWQSAALVRTLSANPSSWLSTLIPAANSLLNGPLTQGPVLQTETAEGLPWVGEVVDVGLDGQLTVRLGALRPPRDVKVPSDRVIVLVNSADEDLLDGSIGDDSMGDFISDEESDEESVEAIEERIEYEGGERLDDGDEEAWQTDEEGEVVLGNRIAEKVPDADVEMVAFDAVSSEDTTRNLKSSPGQSGGKNAPMAPATPTSSSPSSSPSEQTEYQFNDLPSMPPQFLIIDDPPAPDHHFLPGDHTSSNPGSLRRIRKEHRLLQYSLPRGIWVRTWSDRLDLFRILIIGPRGTPYALAPFVFDVALHNTYPQGPPDVFFHSWTGGLGRINPNLYEDGKVCLSILGTWPGTEKTESWNVEHSSLLQVLVSLLGLVLVERPYYNEAGFEDLVGTEDNVVNERVYSEKALVMAKGFVVHALKEPIPGLDDVVNWVYRAQDGPKLLHWVVKEASVLAEQGKGAKQSADDVKGSERLSRGILIILQRHLPLLETMLAEDGGLSKA